MKIININEYKNKVFPKDIIYCGRIEKIWNQCGFSGKPQFGNPFMKNWFCNKEMVLKAYYGYLKCRMFNETYKEKIIQLKGKTLACHCIPEKCHCETIDYFSNNPEDNYISFKSVSSFIEILYSRYIDWPIDWKIEDLKNKLLNDGYIIEQGEHFKSVTENEACITKKVQELLLHISEKNFSIPDNQLNLLTLAFGQL